MFRIPSFGSPGCALIVPSIFLGLLGLGLTYAAVSVLLAGDGDPLENVVLIGLPGVLCLVLGVVLVSAAFKKPDPAQGLFASGENPLQLAARAKTEGERELADEALAEASRHANRLTPKDRQVLDQVKASIAAAISRDEALSVLGRKGDRGVVLANRSLQPIAFAMRPTTTLRYAKGIALEALTWAGVVLAVPLILVSDVWRVGKAVLHRALRWSRRARQYRARPHNIFQRDDRAPVLYLRSFSDDYEESLEGFLPTTAEEKLVSFYNRYGPVIAVGNPAEKLPLLGASRIYFDDSTWQAGVLYLLSVSQLVIIQAGIAPGLLWELGVSRRRLEPRKLIVSFTAWQELDEWTRHLHYLRFKKFAEELLESELPPDIKTTSHLTFETGWAPRPQSDFSYSLPSVRARRNRIKGLVGGAVAVAAVFAAQLFSVLTAEWASERAGANTYSESAAEWGHYKLGSTGMSVDLPAAPRDVLIPISTAMGLREQSAYACEAQDVHAEVRYVWYSDNVLFGDEVISNIVNSAESILKADAENMRRIEGSRDLSYNVRRDGGGTFSLDGEFIKYEKAYKLRGRSLVKDYRVWRIYVLYPAGNSAAASAAQRILDSVKTGG